MNSVARSVCPLPASVTFADTSETNWQIFGKISMLCLTVDIPYISINLFFTVPTWPLFEFSVCKEQWRQVRFEVLTVVRTKMAVFWVVALCGLVYQRLLFTSVSKVLTAYIFRTTRIIALMMEAVRTYETLVNSYQSTRGYIPEDGHLQLLLHSL
jgi:hypothetical protein